LRFAEADDSRKGMEMTGEEQKLSWTGSEKQRKRQGVCLPPPRPPATAPVYHVRSRTVCQIPDGDGWVNERTRSDLALGQPVQYDGLWAVFEYGDGLIRFRWADLIVVRNRKRRR
jgi:hypothetical protein